jgi:heterodisulfide reductase subunit B
MNRKASIDLSFFPGCSLDTTATENNLSLNSLFSRIGYNLVELDDWNCCGSSSAHSINSELASDLATRNLSLAPKGRPLVAACPSCLLRLQDAHFHLKKNDEERLRYEERWGRPFDPELKILHFFEILDGIDLLSFAKDRTKRLDGLRFVPYYGCMLAHPPDLTREKEYHGLMEKILASLGATPLSWPHASQCCGTFLSVARPDIVTPLVDRIIQGARDAGTDCIITACAMCHLNLEVRCSLKKTIPTLYFTEVLSLALGSDEHKTWFSRHLVDPKPLLRSKGLIQ